MEYGSARVEETIETTTAVMQVLRISKTEEDGLLYGHPVGGGSFLHSSGLCYTF